MTKKDLMNNPILQRASDDLQVYLEAGGMLTKFRKVRIANLKNGDPVLVLSTKA